MLTRIRFNMESPRINMSGDLSVLCVGRVDSVVVFRGRWLLSFGAIPFLSFWALRPRCRLGESCFSISDIVSGDPAVVVVARCSSLDILCSRVKRQSVSALSCPWPSSSAGKFSSVSDLCSFPAHSLMAVELFLPYCSSSCVRIELLKST